MYKKKKKTYIGGSIRFVSNAEFITVSKPPLLRSIVPFIATRIKAPNIENV
jgi:hypothetical protein